MDLCGLPSPPGGWLGPFGFFRLVTYAFVFLAVLAIFLGIMAATGQPFAGVPFIGGREDLWASASGRGEPDGFATFAALLLCLGSVVSAGAAYAHEGLEREVSAMKKQNDIFKSKNEARIKKVTAPRERPRCLRHFKDEKRPFYRFRVQNVGFVAMGALEACFKCPRNTVGAAENQHDSLLASAKCPFSGKRDFETLCPINSSSRAWC